MKKLIIPLWVFLLIVFETMSLNAAESMTTPEADYLNAIGLLKGTTEGYELDHNLTRLQGAVMIVRLLGEETAALEANNPHPFSDVPDWGDPYIGYMHAHDLTNGKSDVYFGANDLMTEVQYVTFILRALGYDDQAGDFQWADALIKAKDIGMIKQDRQASNNEFLRRDMANYTYLGLQAQMKGNGMTLEDHLSDKGVLPPTLATAALILSYENSVYSHTPISREQLIKNLERMIYIVDSEETFNVGKLEDIDLESVINTAVSHMSKVPGYSSMLSKYRVSRLGDELKVTMTFNNTYAQMEQAKSFGRKVVGSVIDAEMTEFEKELTIHDYLVNRISYDTSETVKPSAYTIYGALIEGSAVCHGYAESFQLLAYLSGLEAEIVFGEAVSNGTVIGHAWNMVTIEGDTYHIDTTWDDPVMSDGSEVLTYNYFNLTDDSLRLDHTWDYDAYEACDSDDYNYYLYNRQVVYGEEQLRSYMQNAFDNDIEAFSVKMIGEALSMNDVRSILQDCYGYGRIVYRVNSINNVVTIGSVG